MPAKKKACKPTKGKRFAKRVNGKCRSFGQKGKAKNGKDRIQPGTKKVMLSAQEVRASRNARNHPALMLFPAKSGSVVVRSR